MLLIEAGRLVFSVLKAVVAWWALCGAPYSEGWWPLQGSDPHPSLLPAKSRKGLAQATVRFGPGEGGVLLGTTGLIATSASVVRACARKAGLGGGPAAFEIPSTAPQCEIAPLLRVSARDLGGGLVSNQQDRGQDIAQAMVTACESSGPSRMCRWIRRAGRDYLEVEVRLEGTRLRYWPDTNNAQVALLSVEPMQSTQPSLGPRKQFPGLRVGPRIPRIGDELWLVHHPLPALRGGSVNELEYFYAFVLPRLGSYELKEHLGAAQDQVLRQARATELALFSRLRAFPPAQRRPWFSAYASRRTEIQGVTIRSMLDPSLSGYARQRKIRQSALLKASMAPIGPNGAGDARISRGWVKTSSTAYASLRVDAGARVRGGPVVDRVGRVVGVMQAPLPSAMLGLLRFRPEAEIKMAPLYKAARALDALAAPELARALRY